MTIKDEPSTGWFPYLESLLHLPPSGPLSIRFHIKNFDQFVDKGTLRILTIQHRSSFMSSRTATARIIGTLHRLRACVTDHLHLFRGAYELMAIYRARGYSPHLFRSALAALGCKFSEPLWFALSAFMGTAMP